MAENKCVDNILYEMFKSMNLNGRSIEGLVYSPPCPYRVFSTACLSAALDPNLELFSAVYPRMPVLLPVRVKRGPLPESVRVLLVGTGILELLGCLALIPGFEIVELFLELGLEVAFLVGVADIAARLVADGQPTNTGMLDSEVDLTILWGRGVM